VPVADSNPNFSLVPQSETATAPYTVQFLARFSSFEWSNTR